MKYAKLTLTQCEPLSVERAAKIAKMLRRKRPAVKHGAFGRYEMTATVAVTGVEIDKTPGDVIVIKRNWVPTTEHPECNCAEMIIVFRAGRGAGRKCYPAELRRIWNDSILEAFSGVRGECPSLYYSFEDSEQIQNHIKETAELAIDLAFLKGGRK